MTRTTIEHQEMLSELHAMVSFANDMSELQKDKLEDDWKNFVLQVNKQIKNINGVKFE